jgi:hypothetical protein
MNSPIDEALDSAGITRRAAIGRTCAGVATAFLCKLPMSGSARRHAEVSTSRFRYRGFDARIMRHGAHSMLSLRRVGTSRWQEMDHMVFMRMDDGTYVSCLYCTGGAYTKARPLVERLIDDHHNGLFSLTA